MPAGEGGKEGIVREFGMDIPNTYTLLYLKWKTKEAAAIYLLTNIVEGLLFPHILSSIYSS